MHQLEQERRSPAVTWYATLGIALLAAGCSQAPPNAAVRGPAGPRPTPAPEFTLPVTAASHADLVAYAHSLTFDTTAPGVDRRYLVVAQGTRLVVGPFAELAPEIGAAAISHQDLVQGRILARLTVEGTQPVIGSAAGTAYLWVDSVGDALRSVVVPESLGAPMVVTHVVASHYGPAGAFCSTLAVARFMTDWGVRRASPRGGRASLTTLKALGSIACWPCDCKMCCSDTSSSSEVGSSPGAGAMPLPPNARAARLAVNATAP